MISSREYINKIHNCRNILIDDGTIITSDHGEGFGDEGIVSHFRGSDNWQLREIPFIGLSE